MRARILAVGAALALAGCTLMVESGLPGAPAAPALTVGGTVSGLTGSGLVLRDQSGATLAVTQNGPFRFATTLATGASYTVAVQTQPTGPAQECTVTRGSGTMGTAPVTDVAVTCTAIGTPTYTVGGTVTGLLGTGLELRNNGVDPLAITTIGPFTFATALAEGSSWIVAVSAQPTNPAQTCSVSGGSGTNLTANVTGVVVTCSSAPAVPQGIAVWPQNGGAVVSWTPTPGATSYKVYYGTTAALTTSSAKVTAAGAAAFVPGLPNGERRFFAVSAVNASGESALSLPRCGVPTESDTFDLGGNAGLTPYDGMCEDRLDASRWYNNTAWSGRVVGGAFEQLVEGENLEPYYARGHFLGTPFGIAGTPGVRVTTLGADIQVPAATRYVTDGTAGFAVVRLVFQPPALRLSYPAPLQDALVAEVGLLDVGSGLHAVRRIRHCDDGNCSAVSDTGVAFTDPVSFTQIVAGAAGIPVSYGTTYRFTVSLDELTGVVTWRMQGGTELPAELSGTADPTGYLGATPSWSGVPLAGGGFSVAGTQVRLQDLSAQGGGSGKIRALFDNVYVGTNNAAATLWDAFDGVPPSSGPTELLGSRWSLPGAPRSLPDGAGHHLITQAMTSAGSLVTAGPTLPISTPEGVDVLQADMSPVSSFSGPGSAYSAVGVFGRFYNDGSGNTPGNALGDVQAQLNFLVTSTGPSPNYVIQRCTNATCSTSTTLANGPLAGTLGATPAPLRIGFDRSANEFVFGVSTTVTRVPTPAGGAYGKAALAPVARIFGVVSPGSTGGTTASLDLRVNNLMVGSAPSSWRTDCTALDPSVAASVETIAVASNPPPAAGGTPVNGTYRLTATTLYTGPGGPVGPMGSTERFVLLVNGSSSEMSNVNADYGGVIRRYAGSGRIGVSGSNVALVFDCPTRWAIVMPHTATATTLKIYSTSGGWTIEQVFTKQ